MNRSLAKHGIWILITMVTFVAGSQLGRRALQSAGGPGEMRSAGRFLSLTPWLAGSQNRSPEKPKQENAVGNTVLGKRTIVAAAKLSLAKYPLTEDSPPLTEEQIVELALMATKSSNPIERRKAFDRLLQEMQLDTFTKEQAMIMRSSLHQNGASGEQWRAFDYAWGASDPETAVAYIDEIPKRYQDGYTSNMLPGLASVDPQTAIDLVLAMEGGKLYHRMTGRLIEGLADYDIGYATDYVNRLAESGTPGFSDHMRRLTREVRNTVGLGQTVAWAEELDAGRLQATALRSVAHELANNDPLEAADWARQFVGQDQNSRLFGEVVRQWKDVEAATDWVDSLGPSLAQRDALSAVYGFRGSQEPHEAVQDILNMPPSDDRNFAINGFISGLAHQDGEAAVLWAAEITDPGMRQAAQVRAAEHFYRQDQQAAAEWFRQSGLPDDAWHRFTKRD